MTNKFSGYLSDFADGLTQGALRPKGGMANYTHATRLFVDNNYALAPRTKFNYYVRFEIDNTAVKAINFTNRHINEIGYLVKTTQLPKYNFESITKNQYNRKKIIYKEFNYEPLTFTLHDDNTGVINAMWALYYGYYVRDRNLPTSAYAATQYRVTNGSFDNFRYGLDNDITVPFFKSISIYTMARRRFLGYTLINPKIKSWAHGEADYSDGATPMENTMTVEYENVLYSGGNVSVGNPKGFAELHYDLVPSPLSVAGGGLANLLGEGGGLDGLESIFGNIADGTAFSSPGGFLGTVIQGINTYENIKDLNSDTLTREAIGVLSSPEAISGITNTVSGVVGAVLPRSDSQENPTNATQKTLIAGT
jgi:hypothetical protein